MSERFMSTVKQTRDIKKFVLKKTYLLMAFVL